MDKDQEIASLKKTLAGLLALSSAEHAHYKTLGADEQATFLAKSATERAAVVTEIQKRAEEAEKVVYVSKSGDVFKAKDDPRLVEMAKRYDEQAVSIEKAAIRKQAADVLGGMPGTDDAHDLIIRAVTKSGAKQEEIDAALATLKGMAATSSIGKAAPGASGHGEPTSNAGDALAKFEQGLVAFAKAKNFTNVWTDARAAFLQTDEGAQLDRALRESLNG